MIRPCNSADFETIYRIINDAAGAYEGVIPPDCWHAPYMSEDELRQAMNDGVAFWAYEEDGEMLGVMGIQHVRDVTLIRHAYVRTAHRNRGIGGKLLSHLRTQTQRPVLIGTWAAAWWAVEFYRKRGFELVSSEEKDRLLVRYWGVPRRQIETSVVLADAQWRRRKHEDRDMDIRAVVEKDAYAKLSGIELLEVADGSASAKMVIGPQHLNGLGLVHGGAIFTLADLVFAAACNACGVPTVAVNVNISFLKAAKEGTLWAKVSEYAGGKIGAYTIRVTDDAGELVAMFQGLCYRKGPPSAKG